MKKQGVTYTLTKAEVLEQMTAFNQVVLKDVIDDIWSNREEILAMVTDLSNVANWPQNELFSRWAEMCSDKFFEDHPEVDDVLVLVNSTETTTHTFLEKEWLASR